MCAVQCSAEHPGCVQGVQRGLSGKHCSQAAPPSQNSVTSIVRPAIAHTPMNCAQAGLRGSHRAFCRACISRCVCSSREACAAEGLQVRQPLHDI